MTMWGGLGRVVAATQQQGSTWTARGDTSQHAHTAKHVLAPTRNPQFPVPPNPLTMRMSRIICTDLLCSSHCVRSSRRKVSP